MVLPTILSRNEPPESDVSQAAIPVSRTGHCLTATDEAEGILESPAYEEVELMNVELVMLGEDIPFQHGASLDAAEGIDQIVIEVGHPPGETYPGLAGSLDAAVNEELDHEVAVQIRFISGTEG